MDVKDFGNASDDIVCNCEIDTIVLLVFLFRSEKFTLRNVGGGSGLVMGKEVERYFYDIILKKQS